MSHKIKRATLILISLLFMLAIFITYYLMNKPTTHTIPFSQLEANIQNYSQADIEMKEYKNGKIEVVIDEKKFISHITPNSDKVENLVATYPIEYKYSATNSYSIWIIIAFLSLLIATVIYLFKSGKMGATNQLKQSVSKAKPLPSTTLNDVGGLQPEMKDELLQTISSLKSPAKAVELGIKPPKGILLYGPPGTGKTLLAQAIAKELNAKFYSSSGSAFNEMFVGIGAARVRSLFQNARKNQPAVIFIDEVDALAGKRKPHGGEESEKTLTELLVQLDGGLSNDGILFIAATNRKDMLDDAFLRPGRIDFSFHIQLPDLKGRKEIIDIHAKNRQLASDVSASLTVLAESTSGFSGADLHSLFETASRKAILNNHKEITKDDLNFALDRTILGNSSLPLQDVNIKRRVAIHEAGHALIAAVTKPGSVRKATIIPRGQALGYVAPIQKELHLSTFSELLDQVAMILGGGVAERQLLGEHSIGVSGDVQQAKQLLEQMVENGLLEDGFTLSFESKRKDELLQSLYFQALKRAESLLLEHSKAHADIVHALMSYETLDGDVIEQLVRNK
ncbi:AAA family ATPase [Cytobacillus sp. FSL R5-0569]|uniref:AAA family ATPase n=1 Tax=Cytobacillus sp. FSL R5-0569 TaxID=2921649 RepID=UPI0030FCE841